jgi:transposase, IS30 family
MKQRAQQSRWCKRYWQFELEQRGQISIGLALSYSCRATAQQLGCAPSSVSREITRHSDAQHNRPRPLQWTRPRKLDLQAAAGSHGLSDYVCSKLLQGWSAAQIAARLKHEHPHHKAWQLKRPHHLSSHLRAAPRAARAGAASGPGAGAAHQRWGHAQQQRPAHCPGPANSHARPPGEATRTMPGHWEGDLIMGQANHSQVGALLERKSRRAAGSMRGDAGACAADLKQN